MAEPVGGETKNKASLFIIFTTVFLDLVGFGMVIPLVGIYGRHFHASSWELAILGASYSLMQFFFAPFWGSLSDKIGRRPVLLISLAGSTASYLGFGLASSLWFLIASRALGGIFAANISAAQAYIADITTHKDRAKGMGLIGAAFGIGFTLGPPLGGIAAAKISLSAPGYIAAAICGANLLLAIWRLPESLSPAIRSRVVRRSLAPIDMDRLKLVWQRPELALLMMMFFFVTFAFSNMEQTFSLLLQDRFDFSTGEAGYRTGLVLMWVGFVGAYVQGSLIRKLVPRYGEAKLLKIGLAVGTLTLLAMPFGPSYHSYYFIILPMAFASGFVNPTLASLLSKNAGEEEQGMIMGLSQGFGSLARAVGPFCGLLAFGVRPYFPFLIGSGIYLGLWAISKAKLKQT